MTQSIWKCLLTFSVPNPDCLSIMAVGCRISFPEAVFCYDSYCHKNKDLWLKEKQSFLEMVNKAKEV